MFRRKQVQGISASEKAKWDAGRTERIAAQKAKWQAEMEARSIPTSDAPFQIGDIVKWNRFEFEVSKVVWSPGIIGFSQPEWRVCGGGIDCPAHECRKS